MDSLLGGLAGLGLGIGLLLAYVIRQRKLLGSIDSLGAENRMLKEEIKRTQTTESELREKLRQAEIERTEKATLNDELNRKLDEQIKEQEEAAKRMQERFENLANKILEQKSAKFTEANKNLDIVRKGLNEYLEKKRTDADKNDGDVFMEIVVEIVVEIMLVGRHPLFYALKQRLNNFRVINNFSITLLYC